VDPDFFFLLHLGLFPQNFVLAGVPHPTTLIGGPQVEDGLSHK